MRTFANCLGILFFVATATRANAQMTIDQSTTLDYTIDEDIDIVAGASPPTVFLWAGWPTDAHTAVITVVGNGFNYPYGPLPDDTGTLTGVLSSGETISAPFEIYSNASIVLAVPEPSSLALLVTATVLATGWACRQRGGSPQNQDE